MIGEPKEPTPEDQTAISTSESKGNPIPIILFLLMILGGVLIALYGDTQNDLQRYCFVIMISLGAGLGATYLTGQISGGGKFGFINVKSATGGFFVWLIGFTTFLYFFPKPIVEDTKKIQKYFSLAKLSEFGIKAFFIGNDNSTKEIHTDELYSILDNVTADRVSDGRMLTINFSFSNEEIKNNKKFFFKFDKAFREQIAPSIREVEGWHSESTGDEFIYTPNTKIFPSKVNFIIKLN